MSKININTTTKLNNGLSIPLFGLGTWRSEPGVVSAAVEAAIVEGYRHIDCAVAYENHKEVAVGIKNGIKKANIKREDLWITSKLWNTAHNPQRAPKMIDQILTDLQIDYLDLLLIHWPVSWQDSGEIFPKDDKGNLAPKHDESHSMKDTWQTLEAAVDSGKVRSIGISNFNEQETNDILSYARIKPVMNQVESHPFFSNIQLEKFLKQHNIAFTAYSPLGNVSGEVDKSPISHHVIKNIAQKYNKTPAQVIIRWHLQEGRIVIPKSSKPERVRENANVFDFELSQDDIKQIYSLDQGNKGRQVNPPFLRGGKKNFPEA